MLLKFKKLGYDNILEVEPFLQYSQTKSCDFTVIGLLMWAGFFEYEYCIADNVLYIRGRALDKSKQFEYLMPMTDKANIGRAVGRLLEHQRSCYKQESIIMSGITEIDMTAIESFATIVDKTYLDDWSDYIYSYKDLAHLSGKRYSKKRNLIHQFIGLYPDYRVEKLSKENIREAVAIISDEDEDNVIANYEKDEVAKVLNSIDKLMCQGIILYVDNNVVGFAVGEIRGDVLYHHIEKANIQYKGSYQMLNQLFANYMGNIRQIDWINREDDSGDLGLRQAKLSYYPTEILKKYRIEVK